MESIAKKIAGDWIALQMAPMDSEEHNRLFWAHEALDRLIDQDLKEAWNTILEIIERDDSPVICSNLAAGPLEDFLTRGGEDAIALIEINAKSGGHIGKTLRQVWRNSISAETWTRLQSLVN